MPAKKTVSPKKVDATPKAKPCKYDGKPAKKKVTKPKK